MTNAANNELHADDIFKGYIEATTDDVELDYELLFESAETVGNPLAVPLAALIRAFRHVLTQRHDARVQARAEKAVRVHTMQENARLTAQLETARRRIAVLQAEARR